MKGWECRGGNAILQKVREKASDLKKDNSGKLAVGGIIAMVMLVIIGVFMLPVIQDAVGPMAYDNYSGDGAPATTNGTSQTLLQNITLFYILAIFISMIGFAYAAAHMGKG